MTGWTTARTRATRFSAVSRLKALHNAAGQVMKSLFVPNLKLRLLWLAALRPRATLGKIVHLLAVRPAKKCGGDSPLHPLFVCNGEADCVDARDEVNCTRGANARSTINQFRSSAWMDAWMEARMDALMDGCPLTPKIPPETTCSAIRYQCSSGSCILKKNARCDGVTDCRDGSDEADCGQCPTSVPAG